MNLPIYYSYGLSILTTNSIAGGKIYCTNNDVLNKRFWDDFEKYKHLFKIDELVFVEGEVIYDSFRDAIKVNASQVFQLDEVIQQRVNLLELEFNSQHGWGNLKSILQLTDDGSCAVKINYANSLAKCSLLLGETAKFKPNYANLEQLSDIVGKTHWRLQLNRV